MSSFTSFASGGAVANPNVTYEPLGWAADGAGTAVSVTGGGSKGSASATLGTTAAAWVGLIVTIGTASASTARYLVDLSFDGGSTWAIQNLFFDPDSTARVGLQIRIPIIVAAGSDIRGRVQCSVTGSVKLAVLGIVGDSGEAPGFTTFTALNADTTNTRPDDTDVILNTAGYTELVASTAATYGAIMAVVADNGVALTAQFGAVKLATGAAASEVEFARFAFGIVGTTLPGTWSPLFETSIASGSRLSAEIIETTANTDAVRIGLYGLS